MNHSIDRDNRSQEDVHIYQEARIEALLNRVHELEAEIARLKQENSTLKHDGHCGAVEQGG